MCAKAIEQIGLALEFVDSQFITKDICINACLNDGLALEFVDPLVESYHDIAMLALAIDENLLNHYFKLMNYV